MIGKLFASTDKACGKCYNKDKKEIAFKAWDDKNYFDLVFPEEFDEKYTIAKKIDQENKTTINTEKCKNNLVAFRGYHGMASRAARNGILNYASVEGEDGLIRYSGTTENFINDTYLRLQAALSYGGSRNWTEFKKKVKACMRSNAGIIAADTHLDYVWDK